MIVHKCDICKKEIEGDEVLIGYRRIMAQHHICFECGKPVINFLYKTGLESKKDKKQTHVNK